MIYADKTSVVAGLDKENIINMKEEYLKNGMKPKGNATHAQALSTGFPSFHRRVHDLVEPSHLRLEPRHSYSVCRIRRKVEFTSAVLFEIICE